MNLPFLIYNYDHQKPFIKNLTVEEPSLHITQRRQYTLLQASFEGSVYRLSHRKIWLKRTVYVWEKHSRNLGKEDLIVDILYEPKITNAFFT